VESYRIEEEKANYYTGNQHVNRFTPRKNESSGLQNGNYTGDYALIFFK